MCFEPFDPLHAHLMQRYFMPCGCRIQLCDECVPKVARQARCLWCRQPPPNANAAQRVRDADFDSMVDVLNFSNTTINTLRDQLRETHFNNLVLRVEMYHFKRFEWYKAWGFYTGCVCGVIYGICSSMMLHVVFTVGMGALLRMHFVQGEAA